LFPRKEKKDVRALRPALGTRKGRREGEKKKKGKTPQVDGELGPEWLPTKGIPRRKKKKLPEAALPWREKKGKARNGIALTWRKRERAKKKKKKKKEGP